MLQIVRRCASFTTIACVQMSLAVFASSESISQDANVSIAHIIQRSQEREARYQTLDVTWTEDRAKHQASAASTNPVDPFEPDVQGPLTLHQHQYTRRLLLDGERVRFEDSAPVWYGEKAAYYPSHVISVDNST